MLRFSRLSFSIGFAKERVERAKHAAGTISPVIRCIGCGADAILSTGAAGRTRSSDWARICSGLPSTLENFAELVG
jgi:hypothetical protein